MDSARIDRERWWFCNHESGHAIVALINGLPLAWVGEDKDGWATKLAWWYFWSFRKKTQEDYLLNLEFILAGDVAEALVHDRGDVDKICVTDDMFHARRLARVHGFRLGEVQMRVNLLVQEHHQLVHRIASQLYLKGSLKGDRVRELACSYFKARPLIYPLIR